MKHIKITALMLALILTVSAIASCDKIKSIIPGIMGNNDSKGECEHFYHIYYTAQYRNIQQLVFLSDRNEGVVDYRDRAVLLPYRS